MCPLTQPRVGIKSSLSEAVWCPDTESVTITRNTGKQELGPLSPEEAFQLLENNSLYLTRSGVPLSIQAAYTLLLSPVTGVTTTMYLVYSKLSRAGFRVLAHQGMIEQPVMNEKDDNIVDYDEDIDKSQLAPLYGAPLACDPCADPPPWLQDNRDTIESHKQRDTDTPQPLAILHCWVRDIVEDMVEKALECSKEQRINRSCDQMSPKYEVSVSDEEEDRFVPEIVTIEEESEDEEMNACSNEVNCDVSDVEGEEGNGSCEINQLYINPFHEDEASDQENDSISNDEVESESPCPDIVLDDPMCPTTVVVNKSTLNELESMNNFHNIVRKEVNSHVTKARGGSNKSSSPNNFQPSAAFSCKLCSVSCCTKDQLQGHYQGKSHMRKLKLKTGGSDYTCDVCGIKTSSSVTLQSHFEGKKHLKAVASRALRTLSTTTIVEQSRLGSCTTTSRQGSRTPVDDVMIVEDESMGSLDSDAEDVELVECNDDNVASLKTRIEILAEIPNFDGKSLLMLNRPVKKLLPDNTWPSTKHNSFLEVDKFINTDPEKQEASQIVFEHHEFTGHMQSEFYTENQAKKARIEAVEIDLGGATDSSEIIVLDDDIPSTSRKPVTSPLLKPFRGFWSASEVSTPLASVHGTFVQIINFGFHAKPPRVAVSGG